jgi:hypothetical protein
MIMVVVCPAHETGHKLELEVYEDGIVPVSDIWTDEGGRVTIVSPTSHCWTFVDEIENLVNLTEAKYEE